MTAHEQVVAKADVNPGFDGDGGAAVTVGALPGAALAETVVAAGAMELAMVFTAAGDLGALAADTVDTEFFLVVVFFIDFFV